MGNIGGEFTVKVKPWASAVLHPLNRPALCLPSCTAPPNSQTLSAASRWPILSEAPPLAHIPIELQGTAPWTVVWGFLPEGGGSLLLGSLEERHSQVYYSATSATIEASKPGTYRLISVTDGNGSPGKLPQRGPMKVIIGTCPEARIDGLALENGLDVCVDHEKVLTQEPLRLWLSGRAPFTVAMTRFSDTKAKEAGTPVWLEGLQPKTPLVEGINKNGKFVLVTCGLSGFNRPGDHLLRIESVTDADGFKRVYGEWDLGDGLMITAHAPPTAEWSTLTPGVFLEGANSIPLKVRLQGKGPLRLEYQIQPDSNEPAVTETIEEVPEGLFAINASRPGVYRLLSVHNGLCEGRASDAELTVRRAPRPALQASFQRIPSPCHGDLGALCEFSLTGRAPFRLLIEEQHSTKEGSKPVQRWLQADEARLAYRWIPTEPGSHRLKVLRLIDSLYPDGIQIEATSFELFVSPLPDAKLKQLPAPIYRCLGGEDLAPIEAAISLEGSGPWTIDASLEHPDGTKRSISIDADKSSFRASIPCPTTAGRHTLRLISVHDKHNCSRTLEDQQPLVVTVISSQPSVSFVSGQTSFSTRQDGKPLRLPISLSGNKGPWFVDVLVNGKLSTLRISESTSAHINAVTAGRYEIIGIRDAYCSGTVGSERVATVALLSKPSAQFPHDAPKKTCRSLPGPIKELKLQASGKGTVKITYDVQFGHDLKSATAAKPFQASVTMQMDETGTSTAVIPHDVDRLPGYYRYILTSISDETYPNIDLRHSKLAHVLHVLPDPTPRFVDEPTTHCHEPSGTSLQLKIDFAGSFIKDSGPWKVTYELWKDRGAAPMRVEVVEVASGFLSVSLSEPGMYHVRVMRVVDGHGCSWQAPDSLSLDQAIASAHATTFQLLPAPSIRHVLAGYPSEGHACVGDVARFELGGMGPWTLSYSFVRADGSMTHRTETFRQPSVTILLAEPGSLHITGLSSGTCRVDRPNLLPPDLPIHRLPTASIETGKQWVHEDELASFKVHLGGEPPFTFIYQRLDEATGMVLESQTISDVRAHEYTVQVPGVSGTFRIESVHDRYCRYPRLK